jgi:alpha-L-arabinofuranosidase
MNPIPFNRLAGLAVLAFVFLAQAADVPVRLTIDVAHPGHAVSPMLYGVFFEDINYGADGGLYAELVQNRSFEHAEHLYAWGTVNRGGAGDVTVETAEPLNARNPHYVRLAVRDAGQGFGVANYGFGGIAVKAGENYLFAVRARAAATFPGALHAVLEDETGRPLGECRLESFDGQWRKYEGTIKSSGAALHARLVVLATVPGRVDLDMVSLFPENTFKHRRNGLRADLVQMLGDLRPAFLRFPGGCIVEGMNLPNRYQWKDTIGDIAERPENWNRWQDAIGDQTAPQYYQTYGLGFFEYFQLCEDLGTEPLPILNCGMACQYQSAQLVPLDQLGPLVQDALDLIEFANGPVTSTWGAKRAAMGHPEPFHLKFLGVGNEQWGEQYFERYRIFRDAIKAKYPDIGLVTPVGPGVGDHWWELAWTKFRSGTPADIVDEHYYRVPRWFLDNAIRYDDYDRRGPKIFAGEYAAHDRGRRNNLRAALAEAAFMTGLVRNSDVVMMSSYAPLFAKAGAIQWTPDLIWTDNTRVYGSPSYYVQLLFSRNRPDAVLPLRLAVNSPVPEEFPGRVGVGTADSAAEFKDVVVAKAGPPLYRSDFSADASGWKTAGGAWTVVDGALRQTSADGEARAIVGDKAWTNYTLSLKARKLGGRQGFIVYFQAPTDGVPTRLLLGSNGNTQNMLEIGGQTWSTWPRNVPGTIETGRWYDVRVELKGTSIKCYLDGQLVSEAIRRNVQPLYAVAGLDRKSGEVVLMAVNPNGTPTLATVDLEGTHGVSEGSRAIVLTSGSPEDENSFEAPMKIAPREERLTLAGPRFPYTFPANSCTVLRIKPEP